MDTYTTFSSRLMLILSQRDSAVLDKSIGRLARAAADVRE